MYSKIFISWYIKTKTVKSFRHQNCEFWNYVFYNNFSKLTKSNPLSVGTSLETEINFDAVEKEYNYKKVSHRTFSRKPQCFLRRNIKRCPVYHTNSDYRPLEFILVGIFRRAAVKGSVNNILTERVRWSFFFFFFGFLRLSIQ